MWQHIAVIRRFILLSIFLVSIPSGLLAQEIRPLPKWWFGGSAAANFNQYNGTTQILTDSLTLGNPFHRGSGVEPNLALGIEYRHNRWWGGMLYFGFDDRGGKWKDMEMPCGEMGHLSSTLNYFTIEPSIRYAPMGGRLYLFAGPRIGMNIDKSFDLMVEDRIDTIADFSNMNTSVFSAQVGIGYDFHLSKETDPTQVDLSPFVSFHPYMGGEPRSIENWAVTTVRAGLILKIGKGRVGKRTVTRTPEAVILGDVEFAVRAPKAVPTKRRVRESFPLRNSVFFDVGSNEVPARYVKLSKAQATDFNEDKLQEVQPVSFTGRSDRQMTVYYNIINIIGDRMRKSPGSTVFLSGASANGAGDGRARAEAIKRYLVDVFGISADRITVEGRVKPRIASEQVGATMDLDLLREGDSRVDIESSSPDLMIGTKKSLADVLKVQVGGAPHAMLKPVKIVAVVEDPLDSHVILDVAGASEVLDSWTVEFTDEKGKKQVFGPYYKERETISGNIILGDNPKGEYKILMTGKTRDGRTIKKESNVSLVKREAAATEAVRFSILFDFDKSKSVDNYENFLTEVVAPLIPSNSKVIIHGYTDVIGEAEYNAILSFKRADGTQKILERALDKSGKTNVVFESLDFGEDLKYAPFGNKYPEERFYNRTVIIDIVPES